MNKYQPGGLYRSLLTYKILLDNILKTTSSNDLTTIIF